MNKFVGLIVALIGQFGAANAASASGSSGAVVPTNVHAEGGRIFIHGSFANPDSCAISSILVLTPANEQELDRMMSIALTALVAGKKISMWLIGCTPVNWAPSAPQAVSVTIER